MTSLPVTTKVSLSVMHGQESEEAENSIIYTALTSHPTPAIMFRSTFGTVAWGISGHVNNKMTGKVGAERALLTYVSPLLAPLCLERSHRHL